MANELFNKAELFQWLQSAKQETAFDNSFHCPSRDIFQARLDNIYQETKNPLLVAVAGEIGNNAFDHNLGSWTDVAGVYFRNYQEKVLVIADRGQGIKKTLGRIVPNIKNDKEAIEIAFTKVISGRSPEQRGNGLKFVASVVKENNWKLSFYSGKGLIQVANDKMEFLESPMVVNGCVAILQY